MFSALLEIGLEWWWTLKYNIFAIITNSWWCLSKRKCLNVAKKFLLLYMKKAQSLLIKADFVGASCGMLSLSGSWTMEGIYIMLPLISPFRRASHNGYCLLDACRQSTSKAILNPVLMDRKSGMYSLLKPFATDK